MDKQHNSLENTPKRTINLANDNKVLYTERKMLITENISPSNGGIITPNNKEQQ